MSERIINQDLLIRAIADLNDAISNLFALRMLNDEIELSNEPCDVEEDTVTLTVRQMIVRLVVHLARHLTVKGSEEEKTVPMVCKKCKVVFVVAELFYQLWKENPSLMAIKCPNCGNIGAEKAIREEAEKK